MNLNINIFETLVKPEDRISIIGHFNPDGDAIGSISALYHYFKALNIESFPIVPNKYPSNLDFLNKEGKFIVFEKDEEKTKQIISSSSLIICLDFNKLSRIEKLSDTIKASKAKRILIDHHPEPALEEFDLAISDPSASSTCELVFWTLMNTSNIKGDISNLTIATLESLATGLITDTNNFSNSVKASTFEMSALLMKRGINLEEINNLASADYSENRMRLMGYVLSETMIVKEDVNAAIIILSLDTQKKFGYKHGDSEGFVNLPLLMKNINISALFIETNEFIRVSLRSKGDFSVNKLSQSFFNGGGHQRAAGGKLFIEIQDVEEYFLKSLASYYLQQL